MSQVYSTYTGAKPAEQLGSGDGQEWLSCEVCSLTFKNQQHYSIHCGGTFHANRVAASLRTPQASTKSSLEDQQGFGSSSSSNPSYWTGMQQAFSYGGTQQHDSQKSANRSQGGHGGQLNTAAEAYQTQPEYISYPVGKQAKQPSDAAKATGGYEGMYGMPGFGWSDMQPDSSKSTYQSQLFPAAAQLPDLQQMKVTSSAKPATHDAWRSYQQQPEPSRAQAAKDFGPKKPLDYGYSTQDLAATSYSSQKSDIPSWSRITEQPPVQKTESYKSSNKSSALYGSHDPYPSSAPTRGAEREDPWKSAPSYEVDTRGPMSRAKEGPYGKAEQPVRSKTRWDTDDSSSRGAKQRSVDLDSQGSESRRREERASYGRGGSRDGRESSSSRNNEDLYRKRDSSRWEDARERDPSRRTQESDVRDSSKRHDGSYKEMSYNTKGTLDKREIGGRAEVGKGGGWESSYAGEGSSSGYASQRDLSGSSKVGRNENVQLRNQGFPNRAAGKQDIQQFGETEWKAESWDTYGQGWQAEVPEASSQKSLQRAETFGQKSGYGQQQKSSWGGEAVQSKNDASWMETEGSDTWGASAAGGGASWSGTTGYTPAGFSSKDGRNIKTLGRGQMEVERNSSGQLQGGHTWPTANSERGPGSGGMQHNSGIAGDQEWHSVNDVLATFKQASKAPGQKPSTDVGPSVYGDLNQGLSSYTTRPTPAGKPGQRASDPKGVYDWNWTYGAEDAEQEFGESYNEEELAAPADPYHQGVSDWGGNYSGGRGFPQPGLSNASKVGQKAAQANEWSGWPNTEQRADNRGGGAFARDQQAGQMGGRGRGQSGFQETKNLGRGLGFGRGEVKAIEKPVGLSRPGQKGDGAEKQDWARSSFSHGGKSLLGDAPGGASSSAENASWFQETSGATTAGRGGGRGVVGNRPTPQPGESVDWRQGYQEQSKPSVGAGRGGPMRGSESSFGQKNSWGFDGAGVKPLISMGRGFEKGQDNKAPSSNLQEKMRQLSEQGFTRDWSEKGKDLQEPRNPVRTPAASAVGQGNSFIAGAGQRTKQSSSSVPSLLNLNVAPTGKSQKFDGVEDKYSRDAANSKQTSSGPTSSAFGGRKPEQSPVSNRMSGSATTLPLTSSSSRQEFVAPSTGKNVPSILNMPHSQQAATSTQAQKALPPKQGLLPTQQAAASIQAQKTFTPRQGVPPTQHAAASTLAQKALPPKQGLLPTQQAAASTQAQKALPPKQGLLPTQQAATSTQAQKALPPKQGLLPTQQAAASTQAQKALPPKQGLLPTQQAAASTQAQKDITPKQGLLSTPQAASSIEAQKALPPKQGVPPTQPAAAIIQAHKTFTPRQGVPPTQQAAASTQAQKDLTPKQGLLPTQQATASTQAQKAITPKQGLLPTPSMTPQSQSKQNTPVEAETKKPVPPVNVSGRPGAFNRLDPASARKTDSVGDNKQGVTAPGSSTSVTSSSQAASVAAKQTGTSNVVLSKEQAATNITSSASKLDSKVTPAAAAEAKIGLKSSDSQPRGNGPTVTCSSTTTATAAQPAITATAKSAALASSTGNAPRQDSIKKPVAQKSASVAPRDATKLSKEDEDECDPALSEALGQFFSEGKDAPADTAKPAIPPAKKPASGTKFVPTIRTYAVKSMAGFSDKKNDNSSSDNTKKAEQPKKPPLAAVTIKVEKDDFVTSGDQAVEGKAGDPIAKLSKLLPPNLMKGIASGHLSKDLLDKVADLLPADVLKQAVEYLQDSSAVQPTAARETKESQQVVQPPVLSVDAAIKAKADEEKSRMKAVDTANKSGKPMETPSRVQAIQPRKVLPSPAALGSTSAKVPVTGSGAKTPLGIAGANKQPGTLASVAKPPAPSSGVPSKRKYDDIDPTKAFTNNQMLRHLVAELQLKNLSFDEMLQLFQELLQDVLGSLFEEDQKPSAIIEKGILDGLSVEDREMALKVRQTTGLTDLSRIIHTMNVLKSLNSETIQALGQLDKSIIASSLTGNERAQKMGVTVLQQITEVMAKGAPGAKPIGGGAPQVPVGRGRGGSVRPPQPGSSTGRGVQSLLTMNFAATPKPGAHSAGLAGAARPLLPTPRFPQQPRFSRESMMASSQAMVLLPTPPEQAHLLNFPRGPFLRKRGPDEFFGSGPPMKRWR